MGTHPIFESDFDCLTDITMTKELDPSYFELIAKVVHAARKYWHNLEPGSCSMSSIQSTIAENWRFSLFDVASPIIFAGIFLAVRKLIAISIFRYLNKWQFTSEDLRKLPESVFLVLMYSTFWI